MEGKRLAVWCVYRSALTTEGENTVPPRTLCFTLSAASVGSQGETPLPPNHPTAEVFCLFLLPHRQTALIAFAHSNHPASTRHSAVRETAPRCFPTGMSDVCNIATPSTLFMLSSCASQREGVDVDVVARPALTEKADGHMITCSPMRALLFNVSSVQTSPGLVYQPFEKPAWLVFSALRTASWGPTYLLTFLFPTAPSPRWRDS